MMRLSLFMVLIVTGCATPRLTVADRTYSDGQLVSEQIADEQGVQLLWSERTAKVGGASYSKDTTNLDVTAGALGGAAIGAASGNIAAGALVGTVAGGLGDAIQAARDDKKTSATTVQ